MDYNKIGQGLRRNAQTGDGQIQAPNLRDKPLTELGLTGLVERLAMAIRTAEARD